MLNFKTTVFIGLALLIQNSYSATSIAQGLPDANYTASMSWNGHTPSAAFNGSQWNSGTYGTQWLQVDLGSKQIINQVSFLTGQLPDGPTWEKIFISDNSIGSKWTSMTEVASFSGYTTATTPLIATLPNLSAQFVQIVINSGPSWTALSQVSVSSVPEPGAAYLAIASLLTISISKRVRQKNNNNASQFSV